MFKIVIYILTFLYFSLGTDISHAAAKLRVVTTTPDIAWAARQIGGEHVEVISLLSGTEDPHHVDILPSFVAQVSRADVLCQVGLALESAWISRVITRSANSRVQPGSSGECILGNHIEALEVPTGRVNRSMGDVHSAGNPHFTLAPTYMIQGAQAIVHALSQGQPQHRELFEANFETLRKELQQLRLTLFERLSPYRQRIRLMEYHKELSYFAVDYELPLLGTLEEVPGIPPSAGRLSERSQHARQNQVQLVLASLATSERLLRRFQQLSGVAYAQFPTMMMASGSDSDYASWQKRLVDLIIEKALVDDPESEKLHSEHP
jgi:zinc/manganese transport system substrate-binding protein